jgi:hypothetical protein
MISPETEKEALQKFRTGKVLTVDQLGALLHCSVPTVRNHLRTWGALTSYNHNGRYYTLADIPRFDEHGLWNHRGIRFSRYGTLRETVIRLVEASPQGLGAAELGDLLGLDPRSFMSHYKDLPELQREKFRGRYVYLSADGRLGTAQRANREEAMTQQSLQQLCDHDALMVFADFIKHPRTPMGKRVNRLRRQGVHVDAHEITALLQLHGLSEKKTARQGS